MHSLTRIALGIAMLGGTVTAASANVAAGPAGPERYDANRSCEFYLNHDVPAPRRCHRFFSNALGPDVYVRYGFVFRSHDSFVHYRDRGWFKDQNRMADRDDRNRERAEDRSRERHDEERAESRERHEESAERARDESSGGASHGAMVYEKSESGGAGRGEHFHEGSSGGASGY